MARREVPISLQQMLDVAREAVELASKRDNTDLMSDRVLNLAVARLLEVMGEAANRVPRDVQRGYPRIPWVQIISLRNRLIHGYDSVDYEVLWSIVYDDLPSLIQSLEAILEEGDLS